MNEIAIYYENLPPAVRGFVEVDAEGDYSIFINARYNHEQQQEIYAHEMAHILKNHHYRYDDSVQQVESEAEDRAALLRRIKKVESSGLPLTGAILKSLPPYNSCRTVQAGGQQFLVWSSGDVEPLTSFEQGAQKQTECEQERRAFDEERRRELRAADLLDDYFAFDL